MTVEQIEHAIEYWLDKKSKAIKSKEVKLINKRLFELYDLRDELAR